MSNLKMTVKNVLLDAVLTTSPPAVATLPADFLKNIEQSEVMRTTGTSITISGSFAQAVAVDNLVLSKYSLSNTATLQLILKQGEQIYYDSGEISVANKSNLLPLGAWRAGIDAFGVSPELPGIAKSFTHSFSVYYIDSFELVINDPDNPAGWFDIWHMMLGLSITVSKNFAWGSTLEWVDNTTHEEADDGTLRSLVGGLRRKLTLDLNYLNNIDRARTESDFVLTGKGEPLAISAYPDVDFQHISQVTTFIAKRGLNAKYTHNHYNNHKQQLIFLEC
ncbi:MAG: hypothetical protein QM479_16060 [Pseudomonadota bacterium]